MGLNKLVEAMRVSSLKKLYVSKLMRYRDNIRILGFPVCGNRVKPAITNDNRLLCTVCHAENARINEDGTLEFPSQERGKEGDTKKESS